MSTSIPVTTNGAPTAPPGAITIADAVVTKIAGIAAREVSGVHALGGGASRAIGALRDRVPGASVDLGQGISVVVGERQVAVDIDIVAEYGVSIADLAEGIRRNVIGAIERMTGLEVVEVDITVHDVHIAADDAPAPPVSDETTGAADT